jgi:hypothetical protein
MTGLGIMVRDSVLIRQETCSMPKRDALLAFTNLAQGEVAAALAIEVVRIPHVSVLGLAPEREIIQQSKRDFVSLLFEAHQSYRGQYGGAVQERDCALELRWQAQAVEGQPYKANIRLFLLIRGIGRSRAEVESAVHELQSVVVSALTFGGFDYAERDATELSITLATKQADRTVSLVKEEWIENLSNPILPSAFAFERIPGGDRDLSRIASALTEFPGASLSIQLIPTCLDAGERAAIEKMTLALTTLANGITDQTIGTVSFTAATKLAEMYRYLSGHKDSPLFLFNVLVNGPGSAIPVIASRVLGHLSADAEDGALAARFVDVSATTQYGLAGFVAAPWQTNEMMLNTSRDPTLWGVGGRGPGEAFYRLPFILTAFESAELFRLPLGSDAVGAGLTVNTTTRHSRNYSSGVVGSIQIEAGRLAGTDNIAIGFSNSDLTKHAFVTGTPGSGKTTFNLGLLDRLWHEHGIPYLVIEPAKNEYRALVETTPELQVFTPGKDHISPLVLNPFLPPIHVRLQSYKSTLKTAFAAAVTMASPLDRIFEEALSVTYSRYGWFDSDTIENGREVFSILDFLAVFQQTFAQIGYTGDAANIGRAGQVRLKSLVRFFDTYPSIPVQDLLTKPTVIELAGIENTEDKALYIALILLQVLAYVNANVTGDGILKHTLLLEEAHVLLDADEKNGHGEADPAAIAKGLLKRMLAEIRSYGFSIIIADQSPRKVSSDVIALTNIKVAFRLVEGVDRDIVAESTNMSDAQRKRLALLRPGEALMFYDRLEEPEEIITTDWRAERGIPTFVSDKEIAEKVAYWHSHSNLLVPYPECVYLGDWDPSLAGTSKEIARRVFSKHLTPQSSKMEQLRAVYQKMDMLVTAELPASIPDSLMLRRAVKVNFLRMVKYETQIPLQEATIRKTLEAERSRP